MDQLLVAVLLGLGSAALTAGLAVTLVVQYRGTGMINLAAGAIATVGAYVLYELKVEQGWGTGAAFLAGMFACLILGVALELLVVRPLRSQSPLAKLGASLGLLVALQATFTLVFGSTGKAAPPVLGGLAADSVTVFQTAIPMDRVYATVAVVVAAAVIGLGYRYTRVGLTTRAAAENEIAATLFGLPAQRISLYNTVLATVLAGCLGMLVASQTQLDPTTLTLAVVPALAAALLAGFTSFALAAATGFAIGMVQAGLIFLQTKPWFPTVEGNLLPGVAPLFTFVVVVAALWLRGAKLPTRGTAQERRLPPAPEPQRVAGPALGLLLVGLALAFLLPADFRQALMNSLIGMVICLSLVTIVGYVGQVSLMQTALAGVAAFAVQKLTVQAGIGFPVAPILAVGAAVLFGLLAAVPSLRLRGVTLAIGTLAAAVALQQFLFSNTTFGQDPDGSLLPSASLFGLDLGPSADIPGWDGKLPSPVPVIACLVTTVLVAVFVAGLRRSTFGQHMLAVRSNEAAAAASGVSVRSVKLASFAISAGIAGLGGVMTAYSFGTVNAGMFDVWVGLSFVAFAYLGGITTIGGAVVAGVAFPGGLSGVALQNGTGLDVGWLSLVGGLALLVTIVIAPQGLAAAVPQQIRRLSARTRPPGATPVASLSKADELELVAK